MEHEQDLCDLLVQSARETDLSLTESQIAQFMCYLSQLTGWNETVNLTSITRPQDIVIKHFIDSLTALSAHTFLRNAMVVDVGTGAGFPGIPLKIVRCDLKLALIEPSHKKCSFLASVVGLLKLQDVKIFQGTALAYSDENPSLADVVTVRALRFEQIRGHLHRLMASTGLVILYGTTKLSLSEIGKEFVLETEKEFSLPRQSGERVISVLTRRFQP